MGFQIFSSSLHTLGLSLLKTLAIRQYPGIVPPLLCRHIDRRYPNPELAPLLAGEVEELPKALGLPLAGIDVDFFQNTVGIGPGGAERDNLRHLVGEGEPIMVQKDFQVLQTSIVIWKLPVTRAWTTPITMRKQPIQRTNPYLADYLFFALPISPGRR
jgi:hypothetical protein